MDAEPRDAAALARELVPRLRRWTAGNWSHPAEPSGTGTRGRPGELPGPADRAGSREPPTRAEVMAGVVQRLADVGADAEGQPRRPVPRPAGVNPADQLAVMVDDIVRTGDPAALRTAAVELVALRAALGYR